MFTFLIDVLRLHVLLFVQKTPERLHAQVLRNQLTSNLQIYGTARSCLKNPVDDYMY